MESSKLKSLIIIRSAFIGITSALFGFLLTSLSDRNLFFIPFLIFILLIVQIVALVKHSNNINNRILDYLKAITSVQLSKKEKETSQNDSFSQIQESVNDLLNLIQESDYEKEKHKQYLNLIIDYIKVGLISYNQKNEIILINESAKNLFKKHNFSLIEDFYSINSDFYNEINSLSNRKNKLIQINLFGEIVSLTISKSILKIGKEIITNITFQDIRNEIVQNEIESWRRLIKVLRHEILNSITPISTLTDTILSIIQHEDGTDKSTNEFNEEDIADIRESMKSIKSRSKGLIEFVNVYREIDKIPSPKFELISVFDLIKSTKPLFESQLKKQNIDFSILFKNENILLNADFSLIQQVLINVIKNSMQALEKVNNSAIKIEVLEKSDQINISVTDNGIGIPSGEINKIFVPMYTTKENGTGIGLFLSQQIMQLHQGNILVKSEPNIETSFTLSFPK